MPKMPGMGNMNMQGMMKQVQKMQKDMKQAQKKLNESEFVGKSSDDMVSATFTGDRQMKDLQIKPEAIDPDDPDMLSDLVIMAVNDAMKQIDDNANKSLGKYAKGL